MKYLALFFALLGLSIASYAAPRIEGVTLTDAGLEIVGSGFGAENPMLFWDDVKTTYVQENFSEGDPMPVGEGEQWKFNSTGGGWPVTYNALPSSSESAEGSTRSGKSGVVYHGEGRKTFVEQPAHPQPDDLVYKLFASWWYKPSISPSSQGGANKFIRIWDDQNGRGTRISWTQMHLVCLNASDNNEVTEVVHWGDWSGNAGEWNHMMVWLDLTQNRIQAWTNGNLVHDAECMKDSSKTEAPLYVGLIGFDHGSEKYQDMITELDDIYVGASQARVEISKSPTWSPSMEREILPISHWSDSQIITKRIDGVVNLSEDMYVYVVSDDGMVNQEGIKPECVQCPRF